MASFIKRPEIAIFLTAAVGTIVLSGYFFDNPAISSVSNVVILWGSVIARFARFAGTATLALVFIKQISAREKNWQLYIWTLIVMFGTIVIGYIPPIAANVYFDWLLVYAYGPMTMGFSALMGYSLVSACFRSMKIRSYTSAIFVLAWFFITANRMNLLGGVLNPIGAWILAVPLEQGMRAIILGTGIGTIAVSIRSMLGMERGMR